MNWIVLVLLAFLSGALPFSVWIARLFAHRELRTVSDGNPGATNAFRAGGALPGLVALLLDISKAAVPVGYAYNNLGIRGLPMVLIAIAPVLGHAFSPFLGFRGGKALATTLGVWIGLTLWKASLAAVLGVAVGIAITSTPGWAVMLGLGAILAVLLVWLPEPVFFLAWLGITSVLIWTHRRDLRRPPTMRRWIAHRNTG